MKVSDMTTLGYFYMIGSFVGIALIVYNIVAMYRERHEAGL